MVPRLEPCFTLRGYFSESITAGPPRIVTPITHGFFKGTNLDAEIVPGGADCVRVCRRPSQSRQYYLAKTPRPTRHRMFTTLTSVPLHALQRGMGFIFTTEEL